MHRHLAEPILLIIKTAWGGKSLHADFRPPSAGPYELNEAQLARPKEQGKDIEKMKAGRAKATGHYYRLMADHVKKVLGDIRQVHPAYDPERGYKVAGFVWFQGWNDMVDRGTYPDRAKPGGYDRYSEVLVHFIRDVRKEFSAPGMPFVIGVMGVGGEFDKQTPSRYTPIHRGFREAMAAPAALPEFRGNVVAVSTAKCWDHQLRELASRWGKVKAKSRELARDKGLTREERNARLERYKQALYTPEERKLRQAGISNAAYHYLGSAKIMARIGKAFAEAMLAMENK